MGLLKKISQTIEKPFRTGQSRANRLAQQASQESKENFQAFFDTIKPSIETGQGALQGLNELSTPEGLSALFESLQGGSLAEGLISDRERSAKSYLAGTGLRRSGFGADTFADIPTDVLLELMDSVVSGKQSVASLGLGAASTGLGALGGVNTALNTGVAGAQNAANAKSNILGGLISGGAKIGAAFI